jgi:Uncharacterised conserved protein
MSSIWKAAASVKNSNVAAHLVSSPSSDNMKGSISLIEELNRLLDLLDREVIKARDNYRENAHLPQPLIRNFRIFQRVWNKGKSPNRSKQENEATDSDSDSAEDDRGKDIYEDANSNADQVQYIPDDVDAPGTPTAGKHKAKTEPRAKFVPFSPSAVERVVEALRRVAELVIIGENYSASVQKRKDAARSKDLWNTSRDIFDDFDVAQDFMPVEEEKKAENDERCQLFDIFFERGTLEFIANLITGEPFNYRSTISNESCHSNDTIGTEPDATQQSTTDAASVAESASNQSATSPKKKKKREKVRESLLPPLSIAIQAIQSISILIQNVSRAISLYFILSNNHVNKLINFPMDLYTLAERQRMLQAKTDVIKVASAEIAELTTHFVTFLKSLAMRMNAETLQFFLQYQSDAFAAASSPTTPTRPDAQGNNGDDTVDQQLSAAVLESLTPSHVQFPLYERALEYCAAHHDSFVRVTAMNICLNTLRLTTVDEVQQDSHNDSSDASSPLAQSQLPQSPMSVTRSTTSFESPTRSIDSMESSPDGVLYNAKPLPFRERLAIAYHTCTPSRVERLIAPIFSKLAEKWTALEEHVREMDIARRDHSCSVNKVTNESLRNQARMQHQRLVRQFQSKAADLQDELLLLEDVFSVSALEKCMRICCCICYMCMYTYMQSL